MPTKHLFKAAFIVMLLCSATGTFAQDQHALPEDRGQQQAAYLMNNIHMTQDQYTQARTILTAHERSVDAANSSSNKTALIKTADAKDMKAVFNTTDYKTYQTMMTSMAAKQK